MRVARAIVVGVLVVSVLALSGCKKKKPAVPPAQAQAPTITQQPAPETQPAPTVTEPTREQPAPQPEAEAPAPAPAPAPKPKPKRHVAKKTPAPAEKPAEKQPARTVVNDGGAEPTTPQLSASMPDDAVVHQKFNTAQLLEATDYNLKSINRQLTSDEQAMVQHIRSYMQQSRDATKEGDNDLAYRLAFKAHQLSDALVKR